MIGLAFLAGLFLTPGAEAQDSEDSKFVGGSVAFTGTCGAYSDLTQDLLENQSKRVVHRGITDRGQGFEIFADDSGAWMFIYRSPDGSACALDSGPSWENMPLKKGTAL